VARRPADAVLPAQRRDFLASGLRGDDSVFGGDGVDVIWNYAGSGQNLSVMAASGNFFSLLGVNAVLGRTLRVGNGAERDAGRGRGESHGYQRG